MGAENSTWQKGLPSAKLNQFLDKLAKELAADGLELSYSSTGTQRADEAIAAVKKQMAEMKQSWLELDEVNSLVVLSALCFASLTQSCRRNSEVRRPSSTRPRSRTKHGNC